MLVAKQVSLACAREAWSGGAEGRNGCVGGTVPFVDRRLDQSLF